MAGSPLFTREAGMGLACAFAWVLGFGATLAEPALFTLAITVEKLTHGRLSKRQVLVLVMHMCIMHIWACTCVSSTPSRHAHAQHANARQTHTHIQVVMSVALGVGTGTAVGLLKVCCSCSQWQSVIRLLHFIILCVTGACYLCITFHFFCM